MSRIKNQISPGSLQFSKRMIPVLELRGLNVGVKQLSHIESKKLVVEIAIDVVVGNSFITSKFSNDTPLLSAPIAVTPKF